MFYSVLMLAFLSTIATVFSLLAMWLAKQSADGDAAH